MSRLHAKTSIHDVYWKKRPNLWSHLELWHPGTWHPGKGVKPDHVIQFNCGAVHTHGNYKITRTWENFNNQGTKMILLSDELWLIANNSKSFTNGSKPIIRNNLGVCKHSQKGVFLWILQNLEEQLFIQNTSVDCFWTQI